MRYSLIYLNEILVCADFWFILISKQPIGLFHFACFDTLDGRGVCIHSAAIRFKYFINFLLRIQKSLYVIHF